MAGLRSEIDNNLVGIETWDWNLPEEDIFYDRANTKSQV